MLNIIVGLNRIDEDDEADEEAALAIGVNVAATGIPASPDKLPDLVFAE